MRQEIEAYRLSRQRMDFLRVIQYIMTLNTLKN